MFAYCLCYAVVLTRNIKVQRPNILSWTSSFRTSVADLICDGNRLYSKGIIFLLLGLSVLFPLSGETVKVIDVTGKTVEMNLPAGGRNIAATEPVASPRLSSEFIVQQDPAIIIRRMSGDANEKIIRRMSGDANEKKMEEMRDDILSRAGLSKTRAVQNGSVYIIKADILLALRYPIGLLYYAKWFHPEAFKDIDPKNEHRKPITRFFGAEEWEKTKEVFTHPN